MTKDYNKINKLEKEKNVNHECLYMCNSKIDEQEFKKLINFFPRLYWIYVFLVTSFNVLMSMIIAIIFKNVLFTLLFFIVCQISIMIVCIFRLEKFLEKHYKSLKNKKIIDTDFHTEFYEEYLIRQSKNKNITIYYCDINKCFETDTNFYLLFGRRKKVIIIQKDKCDLSLINYLKTKFKNVYQYEKINNYKIIINLMKLLFKISICSILLSLLLVAILNSINPLHGANVFRYFWVFICFIPFPLLLIILGYRYKRKGLNCNKNIIGGLIIFLILLLFGLTSFSSEFNQDYKKIVEYRNIINADLPDNGEIEIRSWDNCIDDDKTNCSNTKVYYDNQNIDNLIISIKNNNNWILSKNIESDLKKLFPSDLKIDDESYILIYNETTEEYNTFPDKNGTYKFYIMKFDLLDKKLEISKFNYVFNN